MPYYTGMFGWLKSRKKFPLREELLTAALVRYKLEDASASSLWIVRLQQSWDPSRHRHCRKSWNYLGHVTCIWLKCISMESADFEKSSMGACQGTRSRFQPLAEMPWCSRRTWAAVMRYDHFAVRGAWWDDGLRHKEPLKLAIWWHKHYRNRMKYNETIENLQSTNGKTSENCSDDVSQNHPRLVQDNHPLSCSFWGRRPVPMLASPLTPFISLHEREGIETIWNLLLDSDFNIMGKIPDSDFKK